MLWNHAPWTAWPGGAFDWGYMPFLYFAVEDRCVRDSKEYHYDGLTVSRS